MAKIQIIRGKGYADAVRAYKIELDGQLVGEIRQGATVEHNLTPGSHSLRLKIDWCSSNTVEFSNNSEETVTFECGNNTNPMFAIFYVLFSRDKYLWLRRK